MCVCVCVLVYFQRFPLYVFRPIPRLCELGTYAFYIVCCALVFENKNKIRELWLTVDGNRSDIISHTHVYLYYWVGVVFKCKLAINNVTVFENVFECENSRVGWCVRVCVFVILNCYGHCAVGVWNPRAFLTTCETLRSYDDFVPPSPPDTVRGCDDIGFWLGGWNINSTYVPSPCAAVWASPRFCPRFTAVITFSSSTYYSSSSTHSLVIRRDYCLQMRNWRSGRPLYIYNIYVNVCVYSMLQMNFSFLHPMYECVCVRVCVYVSECVYQPFGITTDGCCCCSGDK